MKNVVILLITIVVINTISLCASQSEDAYKSSWFAVARSGNATLMEEFIDAGIDIDESDPNSGNTGLMNAVESRCLDAVKLLVSYGADINKVAGPSKNMTSSWGKRCALTSAFRFPEILEFLIASGGDIHLKLNQGRTPLHYAAESETTFEALCILLKYGADVNAKDLYGKTPLHSGIFHKKMRVVLLDSGADIHAADHEGWKPLHHAYYQCDLDLMKELIKRGAPLNEFTPGGMNALQCVCGKLDLPDAFNLIKFLIDIQGMDINEHSRWYNGADGAPTAFMIAVGMQNHLEDDFEILDSMIARGANVNTKIFHTVYGNKTSVIYDSVLPWARDTKVPHYVLEWLRENGAK